MTFLRETQVRAPYTHPRSEGEREGKSERGRARARGKIEIERGREMHTHTHARAHTCTHTQAYGYTNIVARVSISSTLLSSTACTSQINQINPSNVAAVSAEGRCVDLVEAQAVARKCTFVYCWCLRLQQTACSLVAVVAAKQ